MIKTIGYYIFAIVYDICKLLPTKKNRVLCIMTHDDGEGSNVSIVAKALKKESGEYSFSYITKTETLSVKGFKDLKKLFAFFFLKPYQLARAEIVLLDNVFLPFAFLKRKKKAKVVQLWHGTGTIKKFGQDVNVGRLKELEKRANANITHLIVNSPEMKKLYMGAFGVADEFTYSIGMPRTDELLKRIAKEQEEQYNPDREAIYQKYKIPSDKKLVLYAPTFRDHEISNPDISKHLTEILQGLPEEYCLGLRLHPFVAEAMEQLTLDSQVIKLSFESDLNALLMASDLLITDYSSIIFEYCLTQRPMVFYAYDLEEYSDQGRGFYYDYERYVPGPVAHTGNEVIKLLKADNYDLDKIINFKNRHYTKLDANATGRLIELLKRT